MFIQTEATPNPATLKFIPGKPVLAEGTADFTDKTEALVSPLAARLFDIKGVRGVFLGSDFISVTKGEAEWQHLKPMILGAIMEHYVSGVPVVAEVANDGASDAYDPKDQDHRRYHQGAIGDARAPGSGPGRRRHHLLGLPRRRSLPAHARSLLRLPQLHGNAAARHREPTSAFLPRGAGGAGRLSSAP